MDKFRMVKVSQLGVNDEHATLVLWSNLEGGKVSTGDVLCTLETTKTAYDIESETDGHIVYLVSEGDQVSVNQSIAIIANSKKEAFEEKKSFQAKLSSKQKEADSIRATVKARDYALKEGINLNSIQPIDGGIIRLSDLIEHISKPKQQNKSIVDIVIDSNFTPVVVYGSGNGAITLSESLELGSEYRVVCFVDDDRGHKNSLCDVPVFHSSKLPEIREKGICHAATEIMRGDVRLGIKERLENMDFEMINVIHPNSFVSPSVRMGSGNYIKSGAVVETNTVIGDCCIVDNGVVIAHDNIIGNGCHIAPGAVFGSSIELGDHTVIGIGASISTSIRIGRKCIVSVGSSVTKDILDGIIIEGVPGKPIGRTI